MSYYFTHFSYLRFKLFGLEKERANKFSDTTFKFLPDTKLEHLIWM